MPYKNQTIAKFYLLLTGLVIIFLLYVFASILQPFFIAGFIAYLCNPLVERLQKIKVPRIIAVLFVFLLMLSVIILLALFFIPLIIEQLNIVFHKLPLLIQWLQTVAVPWLNIKFGNIIQLKMQSFPTAIMEGIKSHQDIIGKVITTLTSSGVTIINLVFQALLIPVVTFYLLRDWTKLLENGKKILPRRLEPTIVTLSKRYNEVLRAFIRGQLLVMILLGFIYTLGLWLIGLQFALLIGVVAGLLNIVPYLGFITGIITALIASYYQFGDVNHLLLVIMVFLIGQSIESMLLTPLLVGDSIGLHPVAVIFSVLTGGYFLGLLGALIALPVAAAIMVLIRYGLSRYYQSSLYNL